MDTTWAHCSVLEIGTGMLDPAAAIEFVSDPGFGGIALFVGRVRDLNHGRQVTGISYDIFDALAMNVFATAAREAQAASRSPPKIYVAHAKGRLAVGDLAVVVAAVISLATLPLALVRIRKA